MKNAFRYLIGAVIGGCVVGILNLLIPRNNPYVQVTVSNDAAIPIQTARADSEGGIYIIENIPVGSSKTLKLYAAGESSYKLTVTFMNGKTLQGGAGYVESGYKVTENVTNENIKSDIDLHGVY
jgi:hypothetical protein